MKTTLTLTLRNTVSLCFLLTILCQSMNLQGQEDDIFMFRPDKIEACGNVYIDLYEGTINGLLPDASYEIAIEGVPFCSEVIDAMKRGNDSEENYANSVGFRFYFGMKTTEVWKGVKAKTSIKIWGKKPKVLDALFGEAEVKGDFHRIYKTEYGSLYAHLDKRGKIQLISMHTMTVDETWKTLCMDSGYCR